MATFQKAYFSWNKNLHWHKIFLRLLSFIIGESLILFSLSNSNFQLLILLFPDKISTFWNLKSYLLFQVVTVSALHLESPTLSQFLVNFKNDLKNCKFIYYEIIQFLLFLYLDRDGNIFMQLATNRNIREYFLIFKRPSYLFTDHVQK